MFCRFRKNAYLCTRLRQVRALSSAGLEHLPYKQRVGGSNPSAPTSFLQTPCERPCERNLLVKKFVKYLGVSKKVITFALAYDK